MVKWVPHVLWSSDAVVLGYMCTLLETKVYFLSGLCYCFVGIFVVFISFFILLFNVELPNEMKGFVFYVQVIGLVYRPYSIAQSTYDKIQVSALLSSLNCWE